MAVTINYEQIRITELDSYLFGQGTHYEIYNKMGAHIAKEKMESPEYILRYGHQRRRTCTS